MVVEVKFEVMVIVEVMVVVVEVRSERKLFSQRINGQRLCWPPLRSLPLSLFSSGMFGI